MKGTLSPAVSDETHKHETNPMPAQIRRIEGQSALAKGVWLYL